MARIFFDNQGYRWELAFNRQAITRIRLIAGLDIYDSKNKFEDVIGQDAKKVHDLIYAICEPQTVTRNLTAEEFKRNLVGVEEAAVDAFLHAVADAAPKVDEQQKMRREIGAKPRGNL
jgi:hypothetical protein